MRPQDDEEEQPLSARDSARDTGQGPPYGIVRVYRVLCVCVVLHAVCCFACCVLFYMLCVVLHAVCCFTCCVLFYMLCVVLHAAYVFMHIRVLVRVSECVCVVCLSILH